MAGIEMPEEKQQSMELNFGTKMMHSQLKNLSFEESGHRGFQKELTEEQLELIEKVKNKEDVSNRVTDISDESTHEQYPSAKAVFDAVDECGKMELIDSTELTEDVVQISPAINGQYKEFYWVFEIPRQADASTNTEKARFYLYPKLNPKKSDLKLLQQSAWYTINYTEDWNLCIFIKVVGEYVRSELWNWTNAYRLQAYGQAPSVNSQNGITIPNQLITREYIDALTLEMDSKDNTRIFPEGTTYKLWGVRK